MKVVDGTFRSTRDVDVWKTSFIPGHSTVGDHQKDCVVLYQSMCKGAPRVPFGMWQGVKGTEPAPYVVGTVDERGVTGVALTYAPTSYASVRSRVSGRRIIRAVRPPR